jgi:hypothetical protein
MTTPRPPRINQPFDPLLQRGVYAGLDRYGGSEGGEGVNQKNYHDITTQLVLRRAATHRRGLRQP